MKKDQFTQLNIQEELVAAKARILVLRPEVKRLADLAKELQANTHAEGASHQQLDQLTAQVEELVRRLPDLLKD